MYEAMENKTSPQEQQENIELAPIDRDTEKMIALLDGGSMIAMLCGSEILYAFVGEGQYQCYIHPIGSSEGRCKAFPMEEQTRTMLKNLAENVDQLFEIAYHACMDPMGVMYAAETAIHNFLTFLGRAPEQAGETAADAES